MTKKQFLTIMTVCFMTVACTAAEKTDVFTTKNGKKVTITCIKHASMEINYDGMEIQVDPVRDSALPITNYSDFPKAKIVLVTHEHKDHFDREAIACVRDQTTDIYLTDGCYRDYHNGVVLHNGDSIVYAPDILIKAVPAYNTTPGRERFHPKGRDNGYVLTLDGLRIYIAGDTEDIPEMEELKDIDVAFLPCNQPYTMTPEQLVKAANVIKPKVLFPYHYSQTPISRVRMMLMGSGIDVRIRDYQ
ncbi:MAG: MBL fold metallo-hydrolase [Prevotella sp.]|jgi:L-ascorbate metabolism protein UlaG (beta-lactamase superfamily)|nr:MBL fold metallo-hydrolase [Prevotella sp.]